MKNRRVEWQTVAVAVACYAVWAGSTLSFQSINAHWGLLPACLLLATVTALATAFHTSVQHEIVHGHPSPWPWLNEALVFPSLVLVYPFRRYRDLHLIHHIDSNLTDPYEDPESYYWPTQEKNRIGPVMLWFLKANNTLVGRLVLGPLLGLKGFFTTEIKKLVRNEKGVRLAWALHVIACGLVYYWVSIVCAIPFWLYIVLVVYSAVSWILIRSFAEHKAAEEVGPRTAIVEAHPFFATLFLNNNLHIVHHAHPEVAWYDLPALYRKRRQQYLRANGHFVYRGYGAVFKQFAFRSRQPVFHPFHDLTK